MSHLKKNHERSRGEKIVMTDLNIVYYHLLYSRLVIVIHILISRQPMRFLHYLRVLKLGRLKYLIEFYKETAAELTNSLVILQVYY